jgi:hypothetical protein
MYRAMQRDVSRRVREHPGQPPMERKNASEASSKESLLHTQLNGAGWPPPSFLDRQGHEAQQD